MSATEPLIRNISDTARWAATYRARESERRDALFRDPYAHRLAGERGEQIATSMPFSERATWAWVMRTYLFDQLINEQIAQGADMVINLAAGLDARPYRMSLPPSLRWIEVDLSEILDYKEEILRAAQPACALERVRLNLADVGARRNLFTQLRDKARKALILTEGLIIYLSPEAVASLAEDLAAQPTFQRWILELSSPGLLRMLQKNLGPRLEQSGAMFQFAPAEGPSFFAHHGWRVADVRSPLKSAARLNRLPFWMRLLALLPQSNGAQGSRPWSGICLLAKQEGAESTPANPQ